MSMFADFTPPVTKPNLNELWVTAGQYPRIFKRVADYKNSNDYRWAKRRPEHFLWYINYLTIDPTWIKVFEEEDFLPFPEPSFTSKAHARAWKLNTMGNGYVK